MARGDLLTDAEAEFVRSRHAPEGVALIDGFEDSLRILVEDERYSITDIGAMFGVSRERIRQLCVRFGIKTTTPTHERGLFAVRLWSDAENRFAPAKKTEIAHAEGEVRRRERKRKLVAGREKNRAEVLAAVAAVRASGKRVSMQAVARHLFGEDLPQTASSARVRSKWYGRDYGSMKELRDACGIPDRYAEDNA